MINVIQCKITRPMWYTYRRRGRRSCCRTRRTGGHRLRDTQRRSSRTFHAFRTHYRSNKTTLPGNGAKWLQEWLLSVNIFPCYLFMKFRMTKT